MAQCALNFIRDIEGASVYAKKILMEMWKTWTMMQGKQFIASLNITGIKLVVI